MRGTGAAKGCLGVPVGQYFRAWLSGTNLFGIAAVMG